MSKIIELDRSIIPACDVDFNTFKEIVQSTADVEKVGAYKVGAAFLDIGLKKVVDTALEFTNKPIIYDHQKAGTDIPEATPDIFMDAMVRSGVDAVILFPQAGPITEYEWIKAAQDRNLGVIVGGEMTHPRYLERDTSNGKKKDYTALFNEIGITRNIPGFMRQFAPFDIYEIASKMGVTNFVVPGNKPNKIEVYKINIEVWGVNEAAYFSPGLVAQGGEISKGAEAAGQRFHAIVGRGIYKADDMRKAAEDLTSKL